MKTELESRGVQVVALSCDDLQAAAKHKQRDGLSLTLLADPSFEAIDTLGARHRKGITFVTRDLLGIPMGVPIGFHDMAIPTSLLIDQAGIVRWIDQADDYRMRGDAKRVLDAIDAVVPRQDARRA